jgi:prolipoprotein diacylglyceryltransferase
MKLAQKNRLRLQFLVDVLIPVFIYSLIGGRLLAVIQNYQFYLHEFSLKQFYHIIAFWADKDLSFWGAIFAGAFAFIKISKQKQENLNKWADIFIISILFALTIGNFGALLDGANYGKETDLFIGITFNSPIVKYISPIHPTQIYAIIYTLILAIACYQIHKKFKNHSDGIIFWIGSTAFAFCKVIEGFFRGDDVVMLWFIRIPEALFLIYFVFGLIQIFIHQKKTALPFLTKFEELGTILTKKYKLKFKRKKNV